MMIISSHFKRVLSLLAVVTVVVLGSREGFGQLQTVLPPTVGSLTRPGQVGNTSVDRQNRFAQALRPSFSPVGSGASNLQRPAEGAFLSLAGRSGAGTVGIGAARSQGRQMQFGLLTGAGPAVTRFSPVSNNGVSFAALNEFYRRRRPRRQLSPTEILLSYPEYNIRSNAFLAPVQLAVTGSSVDTSTRAAVVSARGRQLPAIDPETPEIPLDQRMSHVEVLAKRMVDARNDQMVKAWESFKEKNYLQAEMQFETVATMDRQNQPAKVGKFLSHLAQRQHTQAAKTLEGMIIRQQDMFAGRPDLGSAFASLDEARIIGSRCDRYAKENPSKPEAYVNLLYYLWLTGYDNDAEQVAQNIQTNFPGTSYARMAYYYISKRRMERSPGGARDESYWLGGQAPDTQQPDAPVATP